MLKLEKQDNLSKVRRSQNNFIPTLSPSWAISLMGSMEPWANCGADPTNMAVWLLTILSIAATSTRCVT